MKRIGTLASNLRRHLFVRRTVTFADQGVSTLSNFLLAVAVARNVSASDFGTYAIATTLYWLFLGGTRALVSEPLLIFSGELSSSRNCADRCFLVFALITGGVGGLGIMIAGVLTGALTFIVLGSSLPLLMWQDAFRYLMISRDRPMFALLSDSTWLAVQAGAFTIAEVMGYRFHVATWLGIWSAAACVGLFAASAITHTWPSGRGAGHVWRTVRKTAYQLASDFLVSQAGVQLIVFGLPLVTSLAVLGAVKAAQVASGPMNTLIYACMLLLLPRVARLYDNGEVAPARRLAVKASLAAGLLGASYTVVLLALPASVGHSLLGVSWKRGAQVFPFIGVQMALVTTQLGAQALLRGTRHAGAALIMRSVITPITVVLPLCAAAMWGLIGFGAASIVNAILGVVGWWGAAMRVTSERQEAPIE